MAHPLLYLLFLVFPLHTLAQNTATIAVNQTLNTASEPWVSSPSGVFAFGFQKIQATEDQFMLCIWYANIPQRTIVWHANISAAPQGSTVRVDSSFGLILSDSEGNKLWSPGDGLSQVIDHAFLNDTGNLVLVGRDSTVVWDTFSHPTDTLLPTQEMEIGGMLISRRSEANFSQGRFYLRMLGDGNMVLSTKSVSTNLDFDSEYYNSGTSDPTISDYKLGFTELGSLYILKGSNKTVEITPPRSIYSGSYVRLSLNFDGVLSLYSIPKISTVNQIWSSNWSQPDNICTAIHGNYGSGACGYNNVCSIDDDNTKRPSCKCPQGYSLIDPSDEYGSCGINFVQICDESLGTERGSSEDLYEIIEVNNTNWPFNDIEHINPCGEDECKASCLNDCLCDVAIYGGSGCWKKRLPLSNGVYGPNIAAKAFLKLRKNGLLEKQNNGFPDKKKDHGTLIVVGSVLLGSSVFINFLFITTTCLGFSFIYKSKIKKPNPSVQSNLHCFLYNELAKATNEFREEIGRGASAIVYKGEIPLGSGNIVAVKKLDRVAHDSEKEFKAEVNVIGQTHHKHLVRLLGYCNEGQHQLLVYEYMRNGSVASFLFSDLTPSWSERTKIAFGIAHGLTYLHEECNTQIIHCDIKPQNILLDEDYNARISDFGLAKLLRVNESRTHTNIRGTKGYVAPEWFRNNKVTVKVDVYSFGILLMEIITGQRSVGDIEIDGSDKVILADWVIDCFQEKRLDLLVENDAEALNDMEMVDRFVMTAIWCIQEDPSLRPTMRKVNQMLEGVVQVPVPPYPYSFT
ncbi:G-type lectin S-receptor-like serine/threonine-protein kinase RLK1 [Ipomoea triloba]|uniref:G-type lectin S-receptor-like serine/threonine-protein kinase RLK1 n=1 Tax=Ipomoea triloba TaxID=35885 RepID=UPI00125D41A8|nr:G-type lectin S-receptor-like serine/threonine-protein kinase RLK1 [Ipomoea triloba]